MRLLTPSDRHTAVSPWEESNQPGVREDALEEAGSMLSARAIGVHRRKGGRSSPGSSGERVVGRGARASLWALLCNAYAKACFPWKLCVSPMASVLALMRCLLMIRK